MTDQDRGPDAAPLPAVPSPVAFLVTQVAQDAGRTHE